MHRVRTEMREPSPRRQSLPIEKEATECQSQSRARCLFGALYYMTILRAVRRTFGAGDSPFCVQEANIKLVSRIEKIVYLFHPIGCIMINIFLGKEVIILNKAPKRTPVYLLGGFM